MKQNDGKRDGTIKTHKLWDYIYEKDNYKMGNQKLTLHYWENQK